MIRLSSGRGALTDAAILIGFGLLLGFLLRALLAHGMDVPLNDAYRWRDLVGNLVVIGVLWSLVGHTWKTLLIASVIIVGFQIGNGLKLLTLGVPISPDDFINVINVVHLLEGVQRLLALAALVVPALLLVLLIRWKHLRTWVSLLLLSGAVSLTIVNSAAARGWLDANFGNSVWNQPENFRKRGLALHVLQESVRTAAKVGQTPDRDSVADALATLSNSTEGPPIPDLSGIDQRNVHMIVLESFFDPRSLGSEWVPDDPVDPEFRALWAETNNSVILSPVFGGYTANAEFEALCGYPVTENAVFFEGWMRRPVPCLPRLFSDAGFQTVASHPNVPGFWNRTHAYRLAGFEDYLSKQDFDLTDSVGGLLMDGSYFEQVFDQLTPDDGPLFNYMLTYYGHLPYPSSERYPDQVSPGNDAMFLNGYLNHVWYKTRDLMARLAILREHDPDSLIVIFGDHLPFLEPNYGVYKQVLGLPDDKQAFTGDMLEFLVTTPLIVIDGKRGPMQLGKLPLYRLPALILKTLGAEQHGLLSWTDNNSDRLYRPVYGMHFETTQLVDQPALACQPEKEKPDCLDGIDWLQKTRVLIADIFTGDQHALATSASNAQAQVTD